MTVIHALYKTKTLEAFLRFKHKAYISEHPASAQELLKIADLLQSARTIIEEDIRKALLEQQNSYGKSGTSPAGTAYLSPLEKAESLANSSSLRALDIQLANIHEEIRELREQIQPYKLRKPIELQTLLKDRIAVAAFLAAPLDER
ncbi:MAG TPA: hypothetical protein VFT64_06095 [Rickettsiales bacterium]|nr:hypothetical protein [Rickettsiales bacterium]